MKILYLFQDEYPWDVRVEKVVWSLAKAHQVTILCRNRGRLAPREAINDVNVVRVGGAGVRSLTGFPAFFSPWWIAAGLSTIRKEGIQLILVRDLPLAPLALLMKKLTGLPVIFDMAEDYPAMISANWQSGPVRLIDYLLRNPFLLRRLEKFSLRNADEVWAVSEASHDRIRDHTKGLIRIVRNTPVRGIFDHDPSDPIATAPLQLVYAGWISVNRGLATVIRAVALGRKEGLEIVFNVVGAGSYMQTLVDLAGTLRVEDSVNFLGWCSQSQMREAIMQSHVGVVPHHVNEHTRTTLPNKIYDYMALGKPVVVSNSPALEGLVKSAKCGFVFRDQDPKSLLECLSQLCSLDMRRELGTNGRYAISESMNWSVDEAVVMGAVDRFEKLD